MARMKAIVTAWKYLRICISRLHCFCAYLQTSIRAVTLVTNYFFPAHRACPPQRTPADLPADWIHSPLSLPVKNGKGGPRAPVRVDGTIKPIAGTEFELGPDWSSSP